MNTEMKLATALRMVKVAGKAVEREYAKCHTGNIYAKGSKYREACYRLDSLVRIIENITRLPYHR